MKINHPLQKRFVTENGYYLIDGKTGRLYKLTAATYKIFEDFDVLAQEQILEKYASEFSAEELNEACEILRELADSPLFLEGPLEQRLAPPNHEKVVDQLEHGLKKLTLELTEACNLRCKYCIYSGGYMYYRKHGFRQMSLEAAIKAVDFYVEHSSAEEESKAISFYGGEPLLHFPVLKEVVTYIRQHPRLGSRATIDLTTNGTLLTEEVIDFLVENEVGLAISIDGPSVHHDRYRVYENGLGTFRRVMTNLKLLKQRCSSHYYNQNVTFNCVVTPTSDLMDLFQFFGENEFLIPFGKVNVSYMNEGIREPFEEFPGIREKNEYDIRVLQQRYTQTLLGNARHSLNFIEGLLGQNLLRIHRRMQFNTASNTLDVEPGCVPGGKRIYVTIDGNVHICERLSSSSFIIGNIETGFDYPFIEGLMKRNYAAVNHPECLHCWAALLCDACYQNQAVFYNRPIHDEPFIHPSETGFCAALRDDMENYLRWYCEMRELNNNIFDLMDQANFLH